MVGIETGGAEVAVELDSALFGVPTADDARFAVRCREVESLETAIIERLPCFLVLASRAPEFRPEKARYPIPITHTTCSGTSHKDPSATGATKVPLCPVTTTFTPLGEVFI
jgi:hypothetical protein